MNIHTKDRACYGNYNGTPVLVALLVVWEFLHLDKNLKRLKLADSCGRPRLST